MYKKYLKRFFDFILSLVAIIILLPFLIPVSIILLLTGEHEVLYLQKRVGFHNKPFRIWKFATMLKNSSKMGAGSITLRNDPRVTPVGKFLRQTKINEVPQIINILKGDMAIVGPRPLMEVDFLKYPKNVQATVYNTRPGLTGIASLVFRDEERLFSETTMEPHEFDKAVIAPYKGALEMWYQQKCSLRTDFMLIILTAWIIFFPASKAINKVFPDLPKAPEELSL